MKNQKGFIQIPLLIAIIAGVLVLGGVGYVGIKKYQTYQAVQIEKEKIAQEAQQQKNSEVEKLRKEVDALKNQPTKSTNEAQPTNSNEISSIDLQPYLSGVLQIGCSNGEGSGSLWNIDGKYSILTNHHVVTNSYQNGSCTVSSPDPSRNTSAIFSIYPTESKRWNEYTDVAMVPLHESIQRDAICRNNGECNFLTASQMNYKLSTLPKCLKQTPVGSPVVIIGYPAFGTNSVVIPGTEFESVVSSLIVSNGVISGYDSTVAKPFGNLPYPNYFVSAKIDGGNSGGITLSKIEGNLCVLGIPTWLTVGNYETQGLVQNIYNIFYQN